MILDDKTDLIASLNLPPPDKISLNLPDGNRIIRDLGRSEHNEVPSTLVYTCILYFILLMCLQFDHLVAVTSTLENCSGDETGGVIIQRVSEVLVLNTLYTTEVLRYFVVISIRQCYTDSPLQPHCYEVRSSVHYRVPCNRSDDPFCALLCLMLAPHTATHKVRSTK